MLEQQRDTIRASTASMSVASYKINSSPEAAAGGKEAESLEMQLLRG